MIRETRTYQNLGEVRYFTPHPLPPTAPPLKLNNEILTLYGETIFALGQLSEMSHRLPDSERFINTYVYKEAML